MALKILLRYYTQNFTKNVCVVNVRTCHSVFGMKDLIEKLKPEQYSISPLVTEQHELALKALKKYYLPEHVLVQAKQMKIAEDNALDEYFVQLLKQGNSLSAKAEDGSLAAVCVAHASSAVDPQNLRSFASYRQDPNTRDFMYFSAKLQETPNLWQAFNTTKIFEIKMLTVAPQHRRQGLATLLVEKAKANAYDQGYHIIRMDCINPYDYKIAERCMLHCVAKYPLHKLRSANGSFIERSSEFNRTCRVYAVASEYGDDGNCRKIDLSAFIVN